MHTFFRYSPKLKWLKALTLLLLFEACASFVPLSPLQPSASRASPAHSRCKMSSYGLGFDFGTSGARINVVEEERLKVVYEASCSYSEQSPQVWVDALETLTSNIPEELRRSIRRISVSGTSASVMMYDRRGRRVTRGPRMYDYSASAASVGVVAAFAPQGHTVRSPTSTLPKLIMWDQEEKIGADEVLCHQADFLSSQFSGRTDKFVSDWNNILKLGYDVKELQYPQWMADLFSSQRISMDILPDVVRPGGEICKISEEAMKKFGLPSDCLVVGGTTDSTAAFIASRASSPGEAVTSLGSTLAIKILSKEPVDDASFGVYSHRLGDMWLVGGASNVGCAVLRQENFGTDELIRLSDLIDPMEDPPEELKGYYPLTKVGERFPKNDPTAQPILEPKPDSRQTYLHALLAAIARVEAEGYAQLKRMGATPVTKVFTAGGGSSNEMWRRMRERLVGVKVERARFSDAAYGVALLALDRAYDK